MLYKNYQDYPRQIFHFYTWNCKRYSVVSNRLYLVFAAGSIFRAVCVLNDMYTSTTVVYDKARVG